MKFSRLVELVDECDPRNDDQVYVQVVAADGVKTVEALKDIKRVGDKCVFVAGVVRSSESHLAMTVDNLNEQLLSLKGEYADLECVLKDEKSDVGVPLNRPYVDGRDSVLVFEADYREFDKNDPKVEDYVLFRSVYGNRTDAIKDLQHVLKSLDMELVGSPRDVKYDKTSKTTSQLYAKVRGTETRHFDLRNGSFFHPDKDTYARFGYKW